MAAPPTTTPTAPETTCPTAAGPLTPEALRRLALELGADDAGLVSLDRPELYDQREVIRAQFPWARSLLSLVFRTSTGPLRSPARSIANREFHHTNEQADTVALELVDVVERRGHRAGMAPTGFPMEMEHFPGRIWVIAHKPVAEAAGLGVTGKSRMVLHPRLGAFVLLGTVVTDLELAPADEGRPLTDSPCSTCNLCVAACPTGALRQDGSFDFGACYTHNYREFMGGFTDWVETIADARDGQDYRRRVGDDESASVWQSLSYGPNYKAAYCVAVCPAGDDLMPRYLADRPAHVRDVVRPLMDKVEPVYVTPGSDAERSLARRFPHKAPRPVHGGLRPRTLDGFLGGLRPRTLDGFLDGLPLLFQPGVAGDLDLTVHFHFAGDDARQATVTIRGGAVTVHRTLEGDADLTVRTDARTWLGIVRGERSPVLALLTRRLRVRGPLRRLTAFQRCFPL